MKLYIDTSDRDTITVGIDNKSYKAKAHSKASQKLLPLIDDALKKNKITTADISEIEVNTGPGSFTGLRVGVAVAANGAVEQLKEPPHACWNAST